MRGLSRSGDVGLAHVSVVCLMPPQTSVQQDLSKGSNLAANPYLISKEQSVLLVNLLLEEHGSVHTRDGTVLQTSSPDVSPSIRPIVKLYDFVTQAGTIIKLAIVKGATQNQLYNRGTTPWTSIGSFGTAYGLPDALTFTDHVLFAAGAETPWSLANDGTTFGQVTDGAGHVPVGAKHQALHQGYYWLWNTNPTSTTYDGPSSLRSSDINNIGSYPVANQLFVDKDDGDQGMGMGQFTIAETGISPTTSQILFKTFSAYQMTGVFGSTSPAFAIQRIKSDMGCVAPRTIRFAPGFGLLRLSHRGVALFNGVDDTLISEEIRPLIFGSDFFTGIDWTNVVSSYAVVVPNPPLYCLFCPTGGAALTRVFCYDLVRRAWTVLQYATSTACVEAIEDPNTLPVVLMGDYANGGVRSIFNPEASAQTTDDGTAIQWEVFARPAVGKSPQQRSYFARAIVKVGHSTQTNQRIVWSVLLGPLVNSTPLQKSGTITLPVIVTPLLGGGAGFGSEPFGSGPFGSSVPNTECDCTIPISLIGTNLRLLLQGSGHILIRGLEYHLKAKPPARPSVYV